MYKPAVAFALNPSKNTDLRCKQFKRGKIRLDKDFECGNTLSYYKLKIAYISGFWLLKPYSVQSLSGLKRVDFLSSTAQAGGRYEIATRFSNARNDSLKKQTVAFQTL